ncbi:glucan endo-1,3-beta-D-glucosidase [Pseudotenacibaculum sp. MALMAid0570]|uniref:glucan endo-1,3-beta-D-glucosidase n=1 Tax=Pseudotenacibaculum sp. MALMAid0570 TaxID=3143938 RepID=UPI0032DFA280
MKKFKYIIGLILLTSIVLVGCQDEDQEFGDIIAPSNIQITAVIEGADAANPNGDGSGVVHFTATANNAVSYTFVYNGSETSAPSGRHTYNFAILGLNTYTVTVVASGTAGVTSSASIQVEVLSTYSPPADLTDKLHGGTSKTWRIKSEKPGHFGLGPVGGTVPTEWYGAGIDEKAGVGMYDDRYVFNADGTFMHITDSTNDAGGNDPTGTIFGRDPLIYDDLGNSGAGTIDGADVLNFPFDDYSGSWALTAPNGVETINLTGSSFIGYYTSGNHQYQIFDRSLPNEMLLRTTDGNGQFDWWFIITTD